MVAGACCFIVFSNPIYSKAFTLKNESRTININSTGAKPLILTKLSWSSSGTYNSITRYNTSQTITNNGNEKVYPYLYVTDFPNSSLAVAESLFIYTGTGFAGINFAGTYYNDYED